MRNMYYIGYTSSISGGTDGDAVFEYAEWTYGAEDDEEEPEEYDLSWFFDRGEDEEYMIETSEDQITRQLFAQYPTPEVMERSSIMCYFDDEANARINHMWINVRCFNLERIPMFWRMMIALAILGAVAAFSAYRLHKKRSGR